MTPLGILIGRGVVSLGRKASVAEALISGLAARCKGPRPCVEPLGGSPGPRELVSGRPKVDFPLSTTRWDVCVCLLVVFTCLAVPFQVSCAA